MRKNLNSILLLVAILLLAYIAFLKPQPQRFSKMVRFGLLVDTATGRLCDARTPSKEAIKVARLEIEKLEALAADTEPDWFTQHGLPPPPEGFVLERPPKIDFRPYKTIQKAKDDLYNLLHPSNYPLCSAL